LCRLWPIWAGDFIRFFSSKIGFNVSRGQWPRESEKLPMQAKSMVGNRE